ncbi:hypothetical protein CSAL01_00999 [Colletotrichum salicis]|uniref:Uncharacterized protein n=1 Tax=Colletotrichum salicis TaxID=1209931 RepID=A0A135UNM8_9PEZI|nr:hypothetical protein CSAL01_00999 [Colletotrichum salicis]
MEIQMPKAAQKPAGKTAKLRPAQSLPAKAKASRPKKPQSEKNYGSTLVCHYCQYNQSRCDEIRRHIREKHYPILFPHLNLQQTRTLIRTIDAP